MDLQREGPEAALKWWEKTGLRCTVVGFLLRALGLGISSTDLQTSGFTAVQGFGSF